MHEALASAKEQRAPQTWGLNITRQERGPRVTPHAPESFSDTAYAFFIVPSDGQASCAHQKEKEREREVYANGNNKS